MSRREYPFLTVLRHPDGWHSDQVATLLHEAAGMDLPTLRLKLRQKPPMLLSQVPDQTADLAIRALRQNGGEAMAVTLAAMEALGPARPIQDLRIESSGLGVDLWRGPSESIDPKQIEVLIRATLAESKMRSQSETAIGDAVDRRMMTSPIGGIWRVGPRPSTGAAGPGGVERRIKTADLLDIHLNDGRIYQIDGDRFSYEVLGDMKGHSDKINMDRMRDLLAHLAPDAIVDDYFSLWRAPAGHKRLRLPRGGGNTDASFAFYSRWSALVYRSVARA